MSTKYVVRCDDYTTPPRRTAEEARAALQRIEDAGHCHLAHEVVEVKR